MYFYLCSYSHTLLWCEFTAVRLREMQNLNKTIKTTSDLQDTEVNKCKEKKSKQTPWTGHLR